MRMVMHIVEMMGLLSKPLGTFLVEVEYVSLFRIRS